MAQNLTKRLDRIERLIKERLSTNEGPIYLDEGEPIPEGREATVIVMQWVEAENQDDDQLEDGRSLEAQDSASRKTPYTLPPSESAEREKRWRKHLHAIDARGDRYQNEQGSLIHGGKIRSGDCLNRARPSATVSGCYAVGVTCRALRRLRHLQHCPVRGAFSFGKMMTTKWRYEVRTCACGTGSPQAVRLRPTARPVAVMQPRSVAREAGTKRGQGNQRRSYTPQRGFYRYEYDEKLATLKNRPIHDWTSHAADAYGLLAVSYEEPSRKAAFNRKLPRERGSI